MHIWMKISHIGMCATWALFKTWNKITIEINLAQVSSINPFQFECLQNWSFFCLKLVITEWGRQTNKQTDRHIANKQFVTFALWAQYQCHIHSLAKSECGTDIVLTMGMWQYYEVLLQWHCIASDTDNHFEVYIYVKDTCYTDIKQAIDNICNYLNGIYTNITESIATRHHCARER